MVFMVIIVIMDFMVNRVILDIKVIIFCYLAHYNSHSGTAEK
jgi:hypothetical protein